MSLNSSKKVIYAALLGNGLIALMKFGAALTTGSSAMLSEGIHSLVDCGNQCLLLFGIKQANRPSDAKHPFGYGMELYFWTFVVAILVFAVGAGVSFYEGVKHILNPVAIDSPYINYIVLGLSMIFEGIAWTIAYREFNKQRRGRSFFTAIRQSKDPTIFTVLFEDSAALIGIAIAFMGVLFADLLNMPVLDGVASLGISIVLAGVSILLAYECKGLLIGEGADPEITQEIAAIVSNDKAILKVNEILTMHLGPSEILVNASIDFVGGLDSNTVEQTISNFERNIKTRFPQVKKIFIEAQSWRAHNADLGVPPSGPSIDGHH